jgi:hypothetical protein
MFLKKELLPLLLVVRAMMAIGTLTQAPPTMSQAISRS